MMIDLGGGPNPRPGYKCVDMYPGPGIDYLCNFETDKLPFDDNSIEAVNSSHCFEHLRSVGNIIREIIRVCKDGAKIEIRTPYAGHETAMIPSVKPGDRHVNAFSPWFWNDCLYNFWDTLFPDVEGRIVVDGYGFFPSSGYSNHRSPPIPQKLIELFDSPEQFNQFAMYHFYNWVTDIMMVGTVRKS